MAMEKIKLLPCPKCGNPPHENWWDDEKIGCGGTWFYGRQKWNDHVLAGGEVFCANQP